MAKRYILELQRKNRKNPTPAEEVLWQALRGGKLGGVRFLRQHDFGRYIADFYCAKARLVIELDGTVHDSSKSIEYDKERTAVLKARGLRVIRFRNEQVLRELPKVLAEIGKCIGERCGSLPPAPSLDIERGGANGRSKG